MATGSSDDRRGAPTAAVGDLKALSEHWPAVLALNNAHAVETSLLDLDRLAHMIGAASHAALVPPDAAFMIAFRPGDDYGGLHLRWFAERYAGFLYVDRIVVSAAARRRGIAGLLYGDAYQAAARLGCRHIACEVNADPPNPVSDAFHAAQGFEAVGEAMVPGSEKRVRYLMRSLAG
ncbi:MAG: GNAT family N-acetyltransferase [Hyphomicrobiales bacterium]|nr:GNAT family N-acetyltransferase [Hyphomicrobiales bacterium]